MRRSSIRSKAGCRSTVRTRQPSGAPTLPTDHGGSGALARGKTGGAARLEARFIASMLSLLVWCPVNMFQQKGTASRTPKPVAASRQGVKLSEILHFVRVAHCTRNDKQGVLLCKVVF